MKPPPLLPFRPNKPQPPHFRRDDPDAAHTVWLALCDRSAAADERADERRRLRSPRPLWAYGLPWS